MKITKTIEQFDCNTFEIASKYYMEFQFDGEFYKGIFICTAINYQENTVTLFKICSLETENASAKFYNSLTIGEDDLALVNKVRRIAVEVGQDIATGKWKAYLLPVSEGEDCE